jgi:sugar lactone lactonase YvrE
MAYTGPVSAQVAVGVESAGEKTPSESLRSQIATLEDQSRAAFENKKWVGFYAANLKLHQLLPYEPDYLVNVVRACGLLDRKSTAYHYMLQLQQQGITYDFNSTDDTLKIRDTEAYKYINNLLINAGAPAGEALLAFDLPGNPADYSAFAWDESRGRFLVGTSQKGKLLAVSPDGEVTELLHADDKNGIWSITGLAVDADNKRLWLSSATTPSFTGHDVPEGSQGALLELDLKSLKVLARYDVPEDGLKHEPGRLAISDDNHIYVIDQATPFIYRKTPEGKTLEAFFGNPDMLGLTDIAVSPDNSRVFVSDALKGVTVIDPIAGQAAMLAGPETMNLGGIGSLSYAEGQLYVIQGGLEPQRIVRLALDASGGLVESVAPMAIALRGFDHPNLGVIWGEGLFYFANAGAKGSSGAVVMSTNLDAGSEVKAPELKKPNPINSQ